MRSYSPARRQRQRRRRSQLVGLPTRQRLHRHLLRHQPSPLRALARLSVKSVIGAVVATDARSLVRRMFPASAMEHKLLARRHQRRRSHRHPRRVERRNPPFPRTRCRDFLHGISSQHASAAFMQRRSAGLSAKTECW